MTKTKPVRWFLMSKMGNTLRGRLLGIYEREDGRDPSGVSFFYRVKLTTPSYVRVVQGGETVVVTATVGTVVCLPRISKTKCFDSQVTTILMGGAVEVRVEVLGEIALRGGRTIVNLDCGACVVRDLPASRCEIASALERARLT
jgi:hypothetical protein